LKKTEGGKTARGEKSQWIATSGRFFFVKIEASSRGRLPFEVSLRAGGGKKRFSWIGGWWGSWCRKRVHPLDDLDF